MIGRAISPFPGQRNAFGQANTLVKTRFANGRVRDRHHHTFNRRGGRLRLRSAVRIGRITSGHNGSSYCVGRQRRQSAQTQQYAFHVAVFECPHRRKHRSPHIFRTAIANPDQHQSRSRNARRSVADQQLARLGFKIPGLEGLRRQL